jgi:hypothetical protein
MQAPRSKASQVPKDLPGPADYSPNFEATPTVQKVGAIKSQK